MVITDLKTRCSACGGSGRQTAYHPLGLPQANPAVICGTCQGKGFALTELGQDVVNMLTPFIQEKSREMATQLIQEMAPHIAQKEVQKKLDELQNNLTPRTITRILD